MNFTLISHFAFRYVDSTSTSSSSGDIAKLKKGIGQSKPPPIKPKLSKKVVVKNNSSKPQRKSHKIALKLEFSNTKDDPIKIEATEEEVSVQRDRLSLSRMNPKSKIVQHNLREVIPLTTFQNLKMVIFHLVRAPLCKLQWHFYFFVPSMNTFPFIFILSIIFHVPYLHLS